MISNDDDAASPEYGPLRSFGRRRARKLTPRQNDLLSAGLAALALDLDVPAPENLGKIFKGPIRQIWLEIGFGGGEHLLWQAEHNPDVGFIACEPFIDGVVKVIDRAEQRGLHNIRIHADDARDALAWLPDASVHRAFILFPDPWPKKRHIKRRLVQPSLLADLARVMPPGAELRLATDIPDYARGMLLAVRHSRAFSWQARTPADWRQRPQDWPATRYEQKAGREGRSCYFLTFRRNPVR